MPNAVPQWDLKILERAIGDIRAIQEAIRNGVDVDPYEIGVVVDRIQVLYNDSRVKDPPNWDPS